MLRPVRFATSGIRSVLKVMPLLLALILSACSIGSGNVTPAPTRIVPYCGHKFFRGAVVSKIISEIPQSNTGGNRFGFDPSEYGGATVFFDRLPVRIPILGVGLHQRSDVFVAKGITILDDANPKSGLRDFGLLIPYGKRHPSYRWITFLTRDTKPVCSWLPF